MRTDAELAVGTLARRSQFWPTALLLLAISRWLNMYVSQHTVKSQAMAVYRKINVTSRNGAVEGARDLGLLEASSAGNFMRLG